MDKFYRVPTLERCTKRPFYMKLDTRGTWWIWSTNFKTWERGTLWSGQVFIRIQINPTEFLLKDHRYPRDPGNVGIRRSYLI